MSEQVRDDAVISYDQFCAVDIRVGRIVSAEVFAQARRPAYLLMVDMGAEIGVKKSSAQLPLTYPDPDVLVGSLVLAVVNFPPKQIGPIMSEVLVLGVPDEDGGVVLLRPDRDVPVGGRMY